MFPKSSRVIAALGLLLPVAAHAHPAEPGHLHIFLQGVMHPLTGIDHLVFMLALGIYAAHLGRRAAGLGIASMVAVVAGAAPLSFGLGSQTVELAVTGSLAIVGIALISRRNVRALVALPVAVVLSFFHGLAHGESALRGAEQVQFIAGVLLSSSVLFGVAALLFAALPENAALQDRPVANGSTDTQPQTP